MANYKDTIYHENDILYGDDDKETVSEYNECDDDLEMPLAGSPLIIGPTLANSPVPMSQGQYPSSESTGNDVMSATWLGIHGIYNP
jgi:hypothetical protein